MRQVSRDAARALVPIAAMLELTGRCNLDCEHCYLDIRHPPTHELSTPEVFDVLDQLAAAGVLTIVVTGGEVFLRHDVMDILTYARRRGFVIRLNTTGTRTTRAHVRQLAALHLASVELSVYSATPALHDAVTRREGSFWKTMRTVIRLRNAGVRTYIKAPLTAEAAPEARAIVALAARLRVKYRLDPLVVPRRDGDPSAASHRAEVAVLADVLRDPSLGLTLSREPVPAEAYPCGVARLQCRVGPSGEVYPCSGYPHAVGNLRQQSFAEIWWGESPLLAELRAIRQRDLGSCGSCAQSGVCGRCLANAVIELGRHDGPVAASCTVAEARTGVVAQPRSRTPLRRKLPVISL